ncbi:helicase associated domain-containing protein [Arthrobacter sp. AQ5-05]|uniref:helicase associated domain-containing protein n=1 Tax=Arthrobacter sp. AQ5-05 TaxID=2184581 RepID=UPI00227D77F6|nr:Helicase associated domain protein [Arthrobacter sp. AQ5-05]
MTVQEIAEFTGRARSTVHRHLQVRESRGEDLRVVHDAAREALGPDWPPTRWQHRYKEVQDFYKANRRLPSVNSEKTEYDLAIWLRSQRTLRRRGALPSIRITLMDMIPDWDASPPSDATSRRTALDDHWRDRLRDLVAFVAESGQMPRYKKYGDELERVLGVWLHTQHQARAEGKLLSWRLEALDATLSGWHSRQ